MHSISFLYRRNALRTALVFLILSFSLLVSSAFGLDESTIPDTPREIVKLTDTGIVPATLTILKRNSSVFLLNGSEDSLVTVEIKFGKKRFHCWSENMQVEKDGTMHSKRPIGPKDFALLCFPEEGTYEYTVRGLKVNPDGVKGKIVITHTVGESKTS